MTKSLLDALAKEKIVIKLSDETHELVQQIDCPQSYCKDQRAADDKTPLRVELVPPEFAEWRCRNCLWSGHVGRKPQILGAAPVDPIAAPKSGTSLPDEAVAYLAAKGMTEEDATKYKLGWDGRRKAIKIPYIHDQTVINHAFVRVSDGKSVLEFPFKATFYGLSQMGRNGEPIVIAQNEIDAMVLMERGIYNVIGLPNGGDVVAEKDEYNHEPDKFAYLSVASESAKNWSAIRFVFEDTPKALGLRQELSRRLGPGKCAAAKLSRPTVALTLKEMGSEGLCGDINEAKPLPIMGLFTVDDFEPELLAYYEYGMASGVPTGWVNVDKLYTVVTGQLTVVTGIPNSGKSEWVDALSMNLAQNFGWRIAAFSPENGKEMHTIKLVEKRVQQSADPKSRQRMNRDTFMAGAQWVNEHYTFIENTKSLPTLDWILERATDAALRYGIKGLIIDPWNRIEKKLGERQSETDYVAESLPKILRFAANYGVHVWLVVHPKQQQKNHKTGKIEAPSLYDMAGSAHFVNMCDNGIVIHRSESMDEATQVYVRKVRFKHVGRRGDTTLTYSRTTGIYEATEEEVTEAQLKKAEQLKRANNGDDDTMETFEVD